MTVARRIAARCPRCRGPLLHDADRYGSYLTCLMCGCVLEETAGPVAARQDVERVAWWRNERA